MKKQYKLIKHWPLVPNMPIGIEINYNDKTGKYYSEKFYAMLGVLTSYVLEEKDIKDNLNYFHPVTEPQKHAFDIVWNSLVGPREVKRLKDGKHFKVGDMTNFGKITHFPCYRDLDCVIVQNQNKYYNTSSVHIDLIELLPAEDKDEFKNTPFELRQMEPTEENALRILRRIQINVSRTDSEKKLKKYNKEKAWIENWLRQHSQAFGRQYRNSSTKTKITDAFLGVRGEGKSKYKEQNPERKVVFFSTTNSPHCVNFSSKPPLCIIPKEIHDKNRLNDINNAIDRYLQGSKDVPAAWLIEKKELETKL